jgi:hypothetical protein
MSCSRTSVLAVLVLVGPQLAAAAVDTPTIKAAVKTDVEAINDALLHGDFDKVADLTHPKVLEMMGGRDKAIDVMRAGMRKMTAEGFAFLAAKVDEPSDPVAGGVDLYVVVPYLMSMKVPGGTMHKRTFVIGQSTDGGKTWRYVNGDLDVAVVRRVLPDLPDGLKLPAKQEPVVDKN